MALEVGGMVVGTAGTTGQEALGNLERRQPDLEARLHSGIQSFYWLSMSSMSPPLDTAFLEQESQ